MNDSAEGLLIETTLAGDSVEDYVRLQALLGADDKGKWTTAVSYWSDYVTVLDLEGVGAPDLRDAS
jgi:hypothetical protein